MSADPSLALTDAVIAALRADTGIAALVGARVYDDVPTGASFPYVNLGPVQSLPVHADQYRGSDLVVILNAWSRKVGMVEAKRIVAALREALDGAALTLAGFRLVSLLVEESRFLVDPDGVTHHGILSFRALIEPA